MVSSISKLALHTGSGLSLRDGAGLEIKKILRSPFGDQLEKYSRQMQIFSHQFESCK